MSAALRTSLALAVLLAACAAADPSGLFAPIGWTGHPIAQWWWWAPYLVYAPLALLGTYAASRAVLAGPPVGWLRRVGRLWAAIVLVVAAAQVVCGALLLLPLIWQQRYVLPLESSAAFVFWSSGYAAVKMLLLGWLPAAVGATARPIDAGAQPAAPLPVVAGTLLLLALLGSWLATHWWQGSALGYVYGQDGALFAPSAAAGPLRSVLALTLIAVVMWRALRASGSALHAGAMAGLALWLLQAALWLLGRPWAAADQWGVPALVVRGLEAGSFALLCACIAVPLNALLRNKGSRQRRAALAVCALALLIAGLQALRFEPPGLAAEVDARTSPGLRVVHTPAGSMLADPNGARVILRGINVNQLGAYQPRDAGLPTVLPLTEQDFADIAALGMNVVRLTLSWSELEPQPGQISEAYLARIATALDWARAHRVYVVLDIHQDAWGMQVGAPPGTECRPGSSPMVGWDGAPPWATLSDGTAPCQFTGRDMAPNVSRAFQSFYMDREGIQTRLVQAWGALAKAFGADPIVAGYDLLNEPNFAETPPIASTLLLANFYARSIAAIREAERSLPDGFSHPVFIEPSIFWSGFGIDNLPPRDFSSDRQIVFSPHLYNESITADQDFGFTFVSIERGVALAEAAARQLRMPLWIGEWGFFKPPGSELPGLERQVRAEDAARIGSAFWAWKQGCGDPHVYPGKVAGNIRLWRCPEMEEIGSEPRITGPLSRPLLRSSPDPLALLRRDAAGISLSGHWSGRASDEAAACALELWLPGERAPQWQAGEGVRLASVTRVAPGQASLGPSGGWILKACLLGGPYRLRLS
ncbi:glycoside hydrolase family 5 protein [Roseateles violae]|uniref:Cellulase family glycosylhydrolase n=1 Tax=Roseateles violae TaxID=3058042 RepID=A0ABT8DVS2_9BURK|nr:cellulase family glycosylhydrolase [Pelomonas sp. PFR6]MDN3922362.1 cellulase family glycosylhydrolase [Pelomonas sp. PFR6]